MKTEQKPDRKSVLLRAAFDLLRKCEDAHYVQEACSVVVFYDGADCDGSCLLVDIADELLIDETAMPLKNPNNPE